MGWLYNWTAKRTDRTDSHRYRTTSHGIHYLSTLELRNDQGNRKGNNGNRNRINGGRRGDSAEDQGGDKDKGNNNGGDNNNNNKNSVCPWGLCQVSFEVFYSDVVR